MKKVNLSVRAILIIVSLHVIVLTLVGIFIWNLFSVSENYRKNLSYSYTRSLGDLTEYLEDIELTLDKSKYVSTPTGQVAISSVLKEAGGGAKSALSYLPFSDDNSEIIEKSLSIIADFGSYIENKSASGQSLSDEDYQIFTVLEQHVEAIKSSFIEIRSELELGNIGMSETEQVLNKSLNLPPTPVFDDSVNDLEEELSALPTMTYDGPYSDHVEKREAEALKGKTEISEQEALQKASEFLEIPIENLSVMHIDDGNLSSYQISGKDNSIRITKMGGEVLYFKKAHQTADNNLSYEEALNSAQSYLTEMGYENLKESFYVMNDNTCTINFNAVQDGVTIYPDLIKMTLELAEGGMVEFSSDGFLMNNRQREMQPPQIDEETAKGIVSDKLDIVETGLAIVPTEGESEVLSYEFLCKDKETGQEVLVYINANTGMEEQIYIVTSGEGGRVVN